MTLVLVRPGRGNYSPVTLTYAPRRQPKQPVPMQVKRGDPWSINGVTYRVREVRA